VFNLFFKGTQLGDFYTMLFMLDQQAISTNRVILNVRYASYVPRTPYQPVHDLSNPISVKILINEHD